MVVARGQITITRLEDGKYYLAQYTISNSQTIAPTIGWVYSPISPKQGEYLWQRTGLVIPPATVPATWNAPFLVGNNGQDAVVYSLVPSTTIVKRSTTGVLTPTTLSCIAHKKVGGGSATIAPTSEVFIKYRTSAMSALAQYSSPITLASNHEWVEFELQNSSGLALDKQTVLILSDSSDMDIGYRNLVLNSDEPITNASYLVKKYSLSSDLVKGKTYTLVMKGNYVQGSFGLWVNGSSNPISTSLPSIGNGLFRYTFTIGIDIESAYKRSISIYNYPSGVTHNSTIEWIKLVEGNTTSNDWVGAPEDITTKYESEFAKRDDAIKLKVSSTEYNGNKDIVNQKFSQLEIETNKISIEVTNRIAGDNALGSRIDLTEDKLSLKVAGIPYEGRNLLKLSDIPITTSNYGICDYNYGEVKPVKGKTYTISLKGTLGAGKSSFRPYNSGGSTQITILYPSDRGADGVFRKTFVWDINDSSSNEFLRVYQMSGSVVASSTIEWIKLEEGERATSKSQAPEDLIEASREVRNAISAINDNSIFDKSEKQIVRIEWEKICGGYYNSTSGYPTLGSFKTALDKALLVGMEGSLRTVFNALRRKLIGSSLWNLYGDTNTNNFNREELAQLLSNYYAIEVAIYDEIAKGYNVSPNILYNTNKGLQMWTKTSNPEEYSILESIPEEPEAIRFRTINNISGWCVLLYEGIDLKQLTANTEYTLSFKARSFYYMTLNVVLQSGAGMFAITDVGTTGWITEIGAVGDLWQDVSVKLKTVNETVLKNNLKNVVEAGSKISVYITCQEIKELESQLDIKDMMLTSGGVPQKYYPSTSSRLMDTGIDIFNKQIRLTADTTVIQDNGGNIIALFNSDGLNADLINTKKLNVERLICYNKKGEKLYSVNEWDDGCPKFYYPNGVVMKEEVFIYDDLGNVNGLETRYYDASGKLKWKTSETGAIIAETDIKCGWNVLSTYYLSQPPTAEERAYLKQRERIESNKTISKFYTTEYNDDLLLELNYNDRICFGAKTNQNATSIPANQWVTGYILEDKTNYKGDDIWANPPIIALRDRYMRRYENGKHVSSGDIYIQ